MLRLQLRNELWKLFGKKRTYIGFGMLLAAQWLVVLVFRFSGARGGAVRALETNGYDAAGYLSGLTFAGIMLFPIAYILMPLYIALVGGDLVAKEAEDGTLRLILSRPISRVRLLGVKWLAGVLFCAALVAALGVTGLLVSGLFFGKGGMFVFVPGEIFSVYGPGEGAWRYALAHGMLVSKAVTILSLALMFSCFQVKPAAATILALSVLFVNAILTQIPFFEDLKPWFLTYHLNLWQGMLADPIPWWRIGASGSLLAAFNLSFLTVGAAAFHARDIKT